MSVIPHGQHVSRLPTAVCHVSTVHPAFEGRIFSKECVSLAQAGYDVHWVVVHDRDETRQGVHVHGLPRPPSRLRRMLLWPWKAYRRVLALRPRPAIVHIHDPELLPMAAVLRVQGFHVVYDVHEDVGAQLRDKHYIPRPVRLAMSIAYRIVEMVLIQGMAIIEADMIEGRYRQTKQSIRNLPLAAGAPTEPRASPAFRGTPVLIYAGGISELRGAWTMLHLADDLKGRGLAFRMRLVGPCVTSGLRDSMMACIRARALRDHVEMTGRVPHEQALDFICQATVGLSLLEPIANYAFSLPTKILEYMTFGLPVVASDLPCTRRYINRTHSGILVDPARRAETADKVARMLDDPERLAAYSRGGWEAVQRGLNWETEAGLLLRFYQRVLGRRVKPDRCFLHRRRSDGHGPAARRGSDG